MEENTRSETDSDEYKWARKFIAENEFLLHNKLMRSFLLNKENCFLLNQSIRYSTPETNKALDEAFRDHFNEIMLISQLSNELRRHAIRYDQKINAYKKRNLLILDQPIDDDTKSSNTLVNLIPDEETVSMDEAALKNFQDLEESILCSRLYHAFRSLTPRQKHILKVSYLFHMTDTEIAAREGVSQQSISKTRKRALRNLRKNMNRG
jgi:RNA polymerase sigma factor (sigma-70 family)